MTQKRVQQKKAVRARRKGDDGDSGEADRERSGAASRRARNVSSTAREFLRRTEGER